jgi:hypothetical protein
MYQKNSDNYESQKHGHQMLRSGIVYRNLHKLVFTLASWDFRVKKQLISNRKKLLKLVKLSSNKDRMYMVQLNVGVSWQLGTQDHKVARNNLIYSTQS